MNLRAVKKVLDRSGEPAYRLEQILRAVYRDGAGSYADITALPAALRRALEAQARLLSLEASRVLVSEDGLAHKALLRLADGQFIESVLLKPKPGDAWSACISCQVGCSMGCAFCSTGLMGLRRDLSSEEISDQALFWRQYLRAKRVRGRLTNVVYMGMGEPLLCLGAVFESLRILLDPRRFGLSARHVAVSTVGIVPGIERFVSEFPQVNLALSLHAADDELRTRLVPVNKAYPLKELAATLRRVLKRTSRKIFLEYVLLAGENDAPRHARAVGRFVRLVGRPDLLHVNLIAFNPTATPYKKPPAAAARAFRDVLCRCGVRVTIRKGLGADIRGACGQLITEGPPTGRWRSPRKRKRPGGGRLRPLA
ncbi:MAG: 23S rRNA (adenine(2503)-C(2))-methyltransferase RlmN [Elusimicrobiota bacterium]